jgi:hypothetical protein
MGKTWPDRLIQLGAFLLLFGAYLRFGRGPAFNERQHMFRVAISVVGFAIGLVGFIIKWKKT